MTDHCSFYFTAYPTYNVTLNVTSFVDMVLFNFFLMAQWPLETVQIQGLEEYYTVFPNCLAGVALSFVVGK